MRLARVQDQSGQVFLARVEGETAVPIWTARHDPLRSALESEADLAALPGLGPEIPLAGATLLAPVCAPSKIVAVGLNYADHAAESEAEPPKAPLLFLKPPSAIIGPGQAITYRAKDAQQVDYEVELAAVVARVTRDVSAEQALDRLLGYTVCNDVSARDAQFADGQWNRGKGFDTFCPLGPWLVTADEIADPQVLAISCAVNGRTLQDSSTKEMIFSVAELVSYISRFMTLEPGDVIATGTPPGVGFACRPPVFLTHGDIVAATVEGIGTLTNPVVVEG